MSSMKQEILHFIISTSILLGLAFVIEVLRRRRDKIMKLPPFVSVEFCFAFSSLDEATPLCNVLEESNFEVLATRGDEHVDVRARLKMYFTEETERRLAETHKLKIVSPKVRGLDPATKFEAENIQNWEQTLMGLSAEYGGVYQGRGLILGE